MMEDGSGLLTGRLPKTNEELWVIIQLDLFQCSGDSKHLLLAKEFKKSTDMSLIGYNAQHSRNYAENRNPRKII